MRREGLRPSRSHLRSVTAVTISVKMNWMLPFTLLKKGHGMVLILCVFYQFQPKIAILSGHWARLKYLENLIKEFNYHTIL